MRGSSGQEVQSHAGRRVFPTLCGNNGLTLFLRTHSLSPQSTLCPNQLRIRRRPVQCRRSLLKPPKCSPRKRPCASHCRPSRPQHLRSSCRHCRPRELRLPPLRPRLHLQLRLRLRGPLPRQPRRFPGPALPPPRLRPLLLLPALRNVQAPPWPVHRLRLRPRPKRPLRPPGPPHPAWSARLIPYWPWWRPWLALPPLSASCR